MPEPNHNSAQLSDLAARIERLMDDKDEIANDIKEIYVEAKSAGFNVRALRAAIKRKRADQAELRTQEGLIADYSAALGVLADTPLGQSAVERATA